MRILWYLLTALFGLIGVLAAVRTIERLVSGAGLLPSQLMLALLMLLFAVLCLRRARSVT
jgi:hypothetical protein